MGFFVNSLQLLERGVRIDFCCLQAFMPQQLSDTLQSCIVVEHGRCEAVPKKVSEIR